MVHPPTNQISARANGVSPPSISSCHNLAAISFVRVILHGGHYVYLLALRVHLVSPCRLLSIMASLCVSLCSRDNGTMFRAKTRLSEMSDLKKFPFECSYVTKLVISRALTTFFDTFNNLSALQS